MAGLTSIGEVVNSGANFTNALVSATRQLEEEKERRDVTRMRAALLKDTNEFLLELQQDNDYQNWDTRINNKMSEIRGKFKQKPTRKVDNPYYAANASTGRHMEEILNDEMQSVQNKVMFMRLAKIQDQNATTSQLTKGDIITNPGYNWKDKIREVSRINDESFASQDPNARNYSDYTALQKNDAISIYSGHIKDSIDSMIRKSENTGATWSEIQDVVLHGDDDFEINILDSGVSMKTLLDAEEPPKRVDITSTIDKESIKNKILNDKKREYDAAVKARHEANYNSYTDDVTKIRSMEDGAAKASAINRELDFFNNRVTSGKEITGAMKEHFVNELLSIRDRMENKEESARKKEMKSIKVLLEDKRDSVFADIKAGKLDAEVGAEALKNYAVEMLESGKTKESAEVKDPVKYLSDNYNKMFVDFMDDFVDYMLDSSKFKSSNQELKRLTTDISKNPDNYDGTTVGWIMENIIDLTQNNTLDKVDDNKLLEQIKKWTGAAYGSKLESLMQKKNYSFNDEGKVVFKGNKGREQYFADNAFIARDNDVMYGKNGELQFRNEKDRKAIENYASQAQIEIASALGITDLGKLKLRWEKDQYGDETAVPTFEVTAADGTKTTYKIEPVTKMKGKKNNKEEVPDDYRIVDQDKKEYAKGKNKVTQEQNKTKQDIKDANAAVAEYNDSKQDEKTRQQFEKLKTARPQEKGYILSYLVREANNIDESILDQIGMTEQEWKKLNDSEKRRLLEAAAK